MRNAGAFGKDPRNGFVEKQPRAAEIRPDGRLPPPCDPAKITTLNRRIGSSTRSPTLLTAESVHQRRQRTCWKPKGFLSPSRIPRYDRRKRRAQILKPSFALALGRSAVGPLPWARAIGSVELLKKSHQMPTVTFLAPRASRLHLRIMWGIGKRRRDGDGDPAILADLGHRSNIRGFSAHGAGQRPSANTD